MLEQHVKIFNFFKFEVNISSIFNFIKSLMVNLVYQYEFNIFIIRNYTSINSFNYKLISHIWIGKYRRTNKEENIAF